MKTMLVLGAGNMAQALCLGFYERHSNSGLKMSFYTPSQTKAQQLAQQTRGEHLANLNQDLNYDFVMIACKPQQFKDLAGSLQGKLNGNAVIVSVMAGVSVQSLKDQLFATKIIRVMPNTPSMIGEGSNLVYVDPAVSSEEKKIVIDFLSAKYVPHIFDSEAKVDQVTGVIGSGPAYVFEFARLMSEYLEQECKLEQNEAVALVKELFSGSSHLMERSQDSLEQLRNNVTSKGGVTFEALESFRRDQMADIFNRAFKNAHRRTLELGAALSASK